MQKESVKAFKNELRNYRYYVSENDRLKEMIDLAYYQLGGVRGIDPSKEPIHSAPNKEFEWKLRNRISRLEQKKAVYEGILNEIDESLNQMDEVCRRALKLIYAEGKRTDVVADIFYLSPSGLKHRMNRAILKIKKED